jgi:hypothetical protein
LLFYGCWLNWVRLLISGQLDWLRLFRSVN